MDETLARFAADETKLATLKKIALASLCQPLSETAAAQSTESMESLEHTFREFCKATDSHGPSAMVMVHYTALVKYLSTLPEGDAPPLVVGELCEVQILSSGKSTGKWARARITAEGDRPSTFHIFIFPNLNGAPRGAHPNVAVKHLRACCVPTVEGLRSLSVEQLENALGRSELAPESTERQAVVSIHEAIRSVPAAWQAPEAKQILFSAKKKAARGEVVSDATSFKLRRMCSGGVASEETIKSSGVISWSVS